MKDKKFHYTITKDLLTAKEIFRQFDIALGHLLDVFKNAREHCEMLDQHEEEVDEETRYKIEKALNSAGERLLVCFQGISRDFSSFGKIAEIIENKL